MRKVSVFSGDADFCAVAEQALKSQCLVKCFSQQDKLLEHLREKPADLVILDNDKDNALGLERFKTIKALIPRVNVIMVSALQDVSHAVLASKLGVSDYLSKPLDSEKLIEAANRIFSSLSDISALVIGDDYRPFWSGTSAALENFLLQMHEAAVSEKDVLLLCEAGMPGSQAAEIIHSNSPAKKKDLSVFDLSSFEKESSESMFWNSFKQMLGETSQTASENFNLAGTIYMDGLGSLSEHFKNSIFDFFLKRKSGERPVDAPRIMIRVCLSEGISREDHDRLKGALFEVRIPLLKERKEDIPVIASALMKKYCAKYGKEINALADDVLKLFMFYDWPGNYEELNAMIENCVLRCKSGCVMSFDAPADLKMLLNLSLREALANNDHFLVSAQNIFKRELVGLLKECSGKDMETVARFLDSPKTVLLDETPIF
ncbi:MAG: response regulator [Candidatus Margulisiibacteriota bacterium]